MNFKYCFKLSLVATITLLSSITYLSCKKYADETPAFYAPKVPLISFMKSWMTDQKKYVSMNIQRRIDSLLSSADWQKAIQTDVSNGKSIMYVPIRLSELGLEFFYDNASKSIDSGNIIKVEAKKPILINHEIVASKTYYETVLLGKAASNPFSGIIHTYSITANFLYEYTFEEGKIQSHGIVAPKIRHHSEKKSNGLQANTVTCEEWGFYIIWEYSPPTLVYTFLVCSGTPDCPPASTLSVSISGSKNYVGVNCLPNPDNGGSPAGGGIVKDETCNYTKEAAQNMLNSIEMESIPYTNGLVYSDEVTDETTGYTEKTWKPSGKYWAFFKTTIPPFYVITWGAYYSGIVYKNNPTDLWKYKSVQYLYSQKVSGFMPPCFSLSVTVTDLGTIIREDRRNATSTIHWYASLTIPCLGGAEASTPQDKTEFAEWGNPD